VLVLRPSNPSGKLITGRRGMRKYQLTVVGKAHRVGQVSKGAEALQVVMGDVQKIVALSSRKDRLAVATIDLHTEAMPMMLPHRVRATIMVSYPDKTLADAVEEQLRAICRGGGLRWNLELISDRPPMRERKLNDRLLKSFAQTAEKWEIPLGRETSVWPSVAGLVTGPAAVVCGLGPAANDIYTPQESVSRISLVQRTLLLAEFLAKDLKTIDRDAKKNQIVTE
jgi:D-alanine-D-alanine ligase